jgi:hypothetical protein
MRWFTWRKLWLCLPPLLICFVDQVVTLRGQPAEYWAGDYLKALEGSPQGLWLLQRHPLAYVAAAFGYMLAFSGAILLLPRLLAQTLAVGMVLGHSWGAATWLHRIRPPTGYWLVLALYTVSAVLVVLSIELSQRKRDDRRNVTT